MEAISVYNLKVSYDGRDYVVDDISFNVKEGEIFGFLGPNGAGKTTTIRVLTTLIKPSSGSVEVLGMDVTKKGLEIRKRIGVILQQPSYEWTLSVEDNLSVYGTLWNLSKEERTSRIESMMAKFDLNEIRKKNASDISIGQRRRLQLVRELMHKSDLLFLDEPTIGLDPLAKKKVLSYFKSMSREGTTIFFTTHNLDEADFLCDRVGIINRGKIYAIDSVENLKTKYEGDKTVEVIVSGEVDDLVKRLRTNVTDLSVGLPDNGDITLKIVTGRLPDTMEVINDFIKEKDNSLLWLNIKKTELEDVFFKVVEGDQHE